MASERSNGSCFCIAAFVTKGREQGAIFGVVGRIAFDREETASGVQIRDGYPVCRRGKQFGIAGCRRDVGVLGEDVETTVLIAARQLWLSAHPGPQRFDVLPMVLRGDVERGEVVRPVIRCTHALPPCGHLVSLILYSGRLLSSTRPLEQP